MSLLDESGDIIGSYEFGTCTDSSPQKLIIPYSQFDLQQDWEIKDGSIELDGGDGTVAGVPSSSNKKNSVFPDEDKWSQKWTIKTHDAVLLTENGDASQEWRTHFIGSPYDYALTPGFPGAVQGGCLSSTNDPELAKSAMHHCDESMSLLVGPQTSLGALRAIADLVEDEGPDRMPGSCCFDTPTTNDKYFGIHVSQHTAFFLH